MGKHIYGEWLIPIVDYFRTLKKKEFNYEWLIPILLSIGVVVLISLFGDSEKAIIKLRDILPNTLAILIGFTITSLTVLISSDNDNIKKMKERKADERKIGSDRISVYQLLLINLAYILYVQMILLIFIFFVGFLLHLHTSFLLVNLFLLVKVFFTLQILLILIRTVTNFYFVFYKKQTD